MTLIKNKIKKFPNSPGVYFFKDKNKKIIYAGRAGSLQKRVLSYFSKNTDSKTKDLLKKTKNISYQKTNTLLEAVILEANLIKKHWPKYNIKEKDNRSFVYLVIPKTDFPKPNIVRGRELEKYQVNPARIFGPYQSYGILKTALSLIRRIFPFSSCQKNSGKPCFHYQIGLCPGVCLGIISKQEYQKNIKNILLLFAGQKKKLLKKLQKENPKKAKALRHIQDSALVKNEAEIGNFAKRIEGYDISHLFGKGAVGGLAVFINGEPDKTQYRLFKIKKAKPRDDLSALEEILERRLGHREWPLPNLILVDGGRAQVNRFRQILIKHNFYIPIVGLVKSGRHAQSAAKHDKLIFGKMKKSLREILSISLSLKQLQAIRNEAHRFAISFNRKRTLKELSL